MKTLLLKIGLIGGLVLSFSFSSFSQDPSYNSEYPKISNTSATSAIAEVNATVGGNTGGRTPVPTYWTSVIVLPSSSSTNPTINDVMTWSYDGGEVVSDGSYGDIGLSSANNTYWLEISNLSPNTSYKAYFVTTQDWETSIIETEITGPTIVEFTTLPSLSISTLAPPDNATNVPIDTDLTMTFSDNISKGTGYIEIHKGTSYSAINITDATISGNTLTLPAATFSLEEATAYHIEMDAGVIQDFSGISDATTWNFTTEAGAPTWFSGYPAMTDQTSSSITMDMQMDQEGDYYYVITGTFFNEITGDQISSGLDGNGNPVTNYGTGQLPLGSVTSASWTFTKNSNWTNPFIYIVGKSTNGEYTDVKPIALDLTPPLLDVYTPSNGAADIAINAPIILNFTEKLYASDGTEVTAANAPTYFSINDGSSVPFTASFSNSDATITLNPTRNLAGNTTCTISFPAIFEDQHENEQGSITGSFSFTTEQVNLWDGSTGTSWSTSENWNGNYTSGLSTIIPANAVSFPVITTGDNITVNNLFIEPGASVTHEDGNLTVNGTFTLQSSADVNASYLPIGGALTAANVKIEQNISDPDRFYFVSPPVDGATKETMGASGNIRYFDNSTSSYLAVDNTTTLETGRGYFFKNPQSVVFSGTINRGEQQISVQRSDAGLGWNLIGNPLSASIEWTQVTPLNVENSFWIWLNDREPGVYGTYNGNTEIGTVIPIENGGIIPSNHAFWVKVPLGQSQGQITIPTSAMQTNTFTYLKSSSTGTRYPSLKLTSDFNGNIDELAIALASEATEGIDNYDTQKMLSYNSKFIEIYTLVENQSIAINGLPASSQPIEIPVGYSAQKKGVCEFSISLNTLGSDATVTIRENIADGNDVYTELTNDGTFSFEVNSTGRNNSRFSLIINTSSVVTGINNENKLNQEKFCSFKSNKNEIITYINTPNKTSYQLFDINGKLLDEGSFYQGSNNIQVLKKGTVILQVKNKEGKNATYKTAF